jgi:hypothetical protein
MLEVCRGQAIGTGRRWSVGRRVLPVVGERRTPTEQSRTR